jgi:hypothetical protein
MCFAAEAADVQCRVPNHIRTSLRAVTTDICVPQLQGRTLVKAYKMHACIVLCLLHASGFASMEVFRVREREMRLYEANSAVGMLSADDCVRRAVQCVDTRWTYP